MSDEHRQDSKISRRQTLLGAGGLLVAAAAGVAGYELNDKPPRTVVQTRTVEVPEEAAEPSSDVLHARGGVQHFVTRPDLRPPTITLSHFDYDAVADMPEFIALGISTIKSAPAAQDGPMVIDKHGRLIYFQPYAHPAFDTNVQIYRGKPTLTYWTGEVIDGHGEGTARVLDEGYGEFITIPQLQNMRPDLHELQLTTRGTAYITAYSWEPANLTAVGGAAQGHVINGYVYEVDLATRKVVWSWNAYEHVGLEESYVAAPQSAAVGYDYFHVNSVADTPDGHVLISGRSCCCLYKVNRQTGRIIWRMHGKQSDFEVGPGAGFRFQHHARDLGGGRMTVFDNASMNPLKPGVRSRGLLLNVDEPARQVTLTQAYEHPAAFISMTQGSVQQLSDQTVFVGWGSQPYFSLFTQDGQLIVDGQLPQGVRSYRAFAVDWTGKPDPSPTAVVRPASTGGFVIFVSWNGATRVHRWVVLAGESDDKLSEIGSQPWTGFETAIVVGSKGPKFRVVAVDRDGNVLGRSAVI